MYKVFFNDSTITLTSEIKKSSKNNISGELDFNSYSFINQIIHEIEVKQNAVEFYIQHHDLNQLWNYFCNRFVEIPASGGFVKNDSDSFLFIKRLGVWDLPKGKIEKKETPEEAAIREVGEECGLSGLQIIRQLDSTYHIYRSPYLNYPENLVLKETKWFLMHYTGNEILVPEREEDIEEVRWFTPAEFDQVLTNTYSSLRDLLAKTMSAI
ncbi:MAG: NUDIX domain-containing protein [Bacteroidota bacterium]|nr:NUDIX domain-containing protein [Bacteroidota bacterium]